MPALFTRMSIAPKWAMVAATIASDASANVRSTGTAIALCTAGELELSAGEDTVRVRRGDAVVVADESRLTVAGGAGTLFLAMPNR